MNPNSNPKTELQRWAEDIRKVLSECFSNGLWPLWEDPRTEERFCRSILLNSDPDDNKWASRHTHRWYISLGALTREYWALRGEDLNVVQPLLTGIPEASFPPCIGDFKGGVNQEYFENFLGYIQCS